MKLNILIPINAAVIIDSMITPYSIHLAGKISEGYFGNRIYISQKKERNKRL